MKHVEPKVMTKLHSNGNYIYITYKNKSYISDNEIIEFLDITEEMYYSMLLKMGGKNIKGEIFFSTVDEAIIAIKQIQKKMDAFLVAKELISYK